MMSEITVRDIEAARKRIAPFITKTPVERSEQLLLDIQTSVYLKLENLQVSGSFKPRGGFNKIIKTLIDHPNAEFVAPTAGGHGVGLSYAAKVLGAKVNIFMPQSADKDRIKDVTNNGASIRFFESVEAARDEAKLYEREKHQVFVSAYNDREMIEGAGTMALELLEQLPKIDCLVCGVGGGGYIAGMAIVLKHFNPNIKIIGVQQDTTPFIYNWFKTGVYKTLPFVPSIAEGVGAMVEEDCITLPYIRKYVDDFLMVNDKQIQETLNWTFANQKYYVEPSGIVGLTAIRHKAEYFQQFENVVTVISGRNISFERLKTLIAYD
jgi:threonine dehydratase